MPYTPEKLEYCRTWYAKNKERLKKLPHRKKAKSLKMKLKESTIMKALWIVMTPFLIISFWFMIILVDDVKDMKKDWKALKKGEYRVKKDRIPNWMIR